MHQQTDVNHHLDENHPPELNSSDMIISAHAAEPANAIIPFHTTAISTADLPDISGHHSDDNYPAEEGIRDGAVISSCDQDLDVHAQNEMALIANQS